MVEVIRHGITRTVILIGRYAIKVPSLRYRGRFFLQGCLANVSERDTYRGWNGRRHYKPLCPVLWCSWGGLLLVMARAEPIPDETWAAAEKAWFTHLDPDWKRDNLGIYLGRLVLIDYA